MDSPAFPPHFNSAQQKAWREYVAKYSQSSRQQGCGEWVDVGAEVYACYGIDIAPNEYCENSDKVRAALKFMGVVR